MTQSRKWSFALCLEYSVDGYIRLTFAQFCTLPFGKRTIIEDEDLRQELLDQDLPAFSAGYCNWLDESTSVQVSVGWAWFSADDDAPQLLAPGGVNSNVMFVSQQGRDLGTVTTDGLLNAWLSARAWRRDAAYDHRESSGVERAFIH
jgi:hypothetical protein